MIDTPPVKGETLTALVDIRMIDGASDFQAVRRRQASGLCLAHVKL